MTAPGTYEAEVVDMRLTVSQARTKGVWMRFRAADGSCISDTRWITAKTRERVEKEMLAAGASSAQLRTKEFWLDPMGHLPEQPRVSVVLEEEAGRNGGAPRLRVKWINALVYAATEEDAEETARIFAAGQDPFQIDDNDIPF
jgi:hypothetical protein